VVKAKFLILKGIFIIQKINSQSTNGFQDPQQLLSVVRLSEESMHGNACREQPP